MIIGPDGFRMSQVIGCLKWRPPTALRVGARDIVDHQIEVIKSEWSEVCDRARMTEIERKYFWKRQFLNPYAIEGYGH